MTDKIKNVIKHACEAWACDVNELAGQTIESILTDLDKESGRVVFWGLFSQSELDLVV